MVIKPADDRLHRPHDRPSRPTALTRESDYIDPKFAGLQIRHYHLFSKQTMGSLKAY